MKRTKNLGRELGIMYLAGVEMRRGKLSEIERKEILMAFDCGYEAEELTPELHGKRPRRSKK
jgi:hypothetical protein